MTAGVSLLGAFAAGLLSFFAPCCLPLVPVYLAYLAGERKGDAGFLVRQAVLFSLGFTAVFVALGASATALGRLLLLNRAVVRQAAGALLVLFGLHLVGLLRLRFLERGAMLVKAAPGSWAGWGRPILLGVAFSAGWQPCIGPVLGGILALAGAEGTVAGGMLLLLAYSLGLALPYVAAAAFVGRFRHRLPALMARAEQARRVSGYLLVVLGLLVFFNWLGRLSGWIPWTPVL